MTDADRERRKKEMHNLVDKLAVVFLGERPLLGQLEYDSKNSMAILKDAYPISMNPMGLNKEGKPAKTEEEVVRIVNVPQLGILHFCAYEGVSRLFIPKSTPRYLIKDQSVATQAAFSKAYHDFKEGLQSIQYGLIQPAGMADIPKAAEAIDIFKGKNRG